MTSAVRAAGPVEQVAARIWNVANEGKPFTVVFGLALLVLTGAPLAGVLLCAPLFAAWWRHAYPLHLRMALWALAVGAVIVAGVPRWPSLAAALSLYVVFTVFIWGTLYYHLRLGARWTNFARFWRLVVENPDPTSGNFLEQIPKLAALLAVGHSTRPALALIALGAVVVAVGEVIHRRLITWVPGWATGDAPPDRRPLRLGPAACGPRSDKVLLVVIDGCRIDRLAEADTPFLDRLAAEGVVVENCHTVYPARTVTGFSSMLTGAPPAVHRLRSNFAPSLGVKCESIFDVVPRSRLVGIAHLIDAFGDRVRSVTAVMPNDDIDAALCARARAVLEAEDPDLLVVQTLSVDQTGHFRGSYHDEYRERIEATDRELERFVGWVLEQWEGQRVTVGVLSDHGQGRGIGGHGHWTPTERVVPCIWWGVGAQALSAPPDGRPPSLLDVAPTIAHRLGARVPDRSVGRCMLCAAEPARASGPVVVVLPVHDEAESLGSVIEAMPPEVDVVVVDDGSTDGSADIALAAGAKVISHDGNRGLGAAIRTGFEEARRRDAQAVAFLDADGEYDPRELPRLLGRILDGNADYVVGSRFSAGKPDMRWQRRVGNRVLTWLTSMVARRRLGDAQSGFRALSADALAAATIAHDYNYAQILTLDLLRKGFRYAEVPISYRRRRSGRSFVTPVRYARRVLPAMVRAARVT